jgi:hypothetical protein
MSEWLDDDARADALGGYPVKDGYRGVRTLVFFAVAAAVLAAVILIIDNGIKKSILQEGAELREELNDERQRRAGERRGQGRTGDQDHHEPGEPAVHPLGDLADGPGAPEEAVPDAPVTGDPEQRKVSGMPRRKAGDAGGSPLRRP